MGDGLADMAGVVQRPTPAAMAAPLVLKGPECD
jgi:hypothetical protein